MAGCSCGKKNCSCGGKHSKVTKGKYAEGGKVVTTMTTTRTPDGGQQYVRGSTTKEKLRTAQNVDNRYSDTTRGKTRSPRVAEMLAVTRSFATGESGNPKRDAKHAAAMGKISREGAEAQNAITRKYGDKTRR